jgi:hypothetical protein
MGEVQKKIIEDFVSEFISDPLTVKEPEVTVLSAQLGTDKSHRTNHF